MKFVKIVSIIFVGVFSLLYVGLFTSFGQGLWLPTVENIVKEKSGIKKFEFAKFELDFSHLNTTLLVEDQKIQVNADFDILSKDLNLQYTIDIQDLSKFNYLSKQKVRGTFFTQGTVQGTFENLAIKGDAKIANGDINYSLNLLEYQPTQIQANLQKIKIEELLYMVHQPQYISGLFQANTELSSTKLEKLSLDANVKKGLVNIALVKELHDITLPNSDFTLQANAQILQGLGDFNLQLDSSLLKVQTNGDVDTNKLYVDGKYNINIVALEILEKINGLKLNGSFQTNGTVVGDKQKLLIDGTTDIAKSDTRYTIELKQFEPTNIKLDLVKAHLSELLHIVNQPQYVQKGTLSSSVEISSLKPLNGKAKTTIENGLLSNKTIKKEFDIDLPSKPTFSLVANTKLQNTDIISDIVLDSFAAKLTTAKTHYDLEKAKLVTDYTLDVASLGDLYFITKQKMRGDITVVGDVTFDKTLLATFRSKKFGGDIDGVFDDTKLTVDMKNIATMQLLHMLYYPEIFESKLKLDLDYDIKSKQGVAKLDMGNGQFKNTDTLKMISRILNRDISLEVYKIANITSNIDDTRINSDLYFESDNIKLQSKKFFIETQKQDLDSKFDLSYKKMTIGIEAKGKITDPKMKVNFNKVAKQKVKDEIQKAIEKNLKDDSGEKIKGILNNFFN
jgi:hypothetical protein